MSRPVRVDPVFYSRLHLALDDFDDSVEAEVEFVGRHLTAVEEAFANQWDTLRGSPGETTVRWVDGALTTIPALFSVQGLLTADGVIELCNIRIVVDPDS